MYLTCSKSSKMNILPEIIKSLSKEEARAFKLFANRTNAGDERMDIALFDFYKKNYPELDDDDAFKLLYTTGDKNAYYRLKNRLTQDIGASLLLLNIYENEIHFVLNHYLLAKIFVAKNKWQIALHLLTKAERKALDIENNELLDLVYSEFIKLSHEVLEINPEDYINKRKANRTQLQTIQEIDDVLAAVIYRVRVSQNFSKGNTKINDLLSKTVATFSKSKAVKESPQLRFKIYHAVSRILLQEQNYVELETYLLKTFAEFSKENLFNKNNHDTKLQMLTYISNALFKNSKSDLSLNYVQRLKQGMEEFNGVLHDKYLFFYYNIIVNNYAKSNVEKAIDVLNEAKEQTVIKNHPVYIGFVYLNLSISYFGIKDYKQSLKSLVKFYLLDSFKTLDVGFRLKVALAEIIIRYELGDVDFIEERIKQINKEFKVELKQSQFSNEKSVLEITNDLCEQPNLKSNKALANKVKQFLANHKDISEGETEIINYGLWLKEKV